MGSVVHLLAKEVGCRVLPPIYRFDQRFHVIWQSPTKLKILNLAYCSEAVAGLVTALANLAEEQHSPL